MRGEKEQEEQEEEQEQEAMQATVDKAKREAQEA